MAEQLPLIVDELIGKATVVNDHIVLVEQEGTGAIYILDTKTAHGSDQAYRAKQVLFTRPATEAEAKNIELRKQRKQLEELQAQQAAAPTTPPAPPKPAKAEIIPTSASEKPTKR